MTFRQLGKPLTGVLCMTPRDFLPAPASEPFEVEAVDPISEP